MAGRAGSAYPPSSYTLTTAMMMHMVNLSMDLINGFTAQVFRDLDAL